MITPTILLISVEDDVKEELKDIFEKVKLVEIPLSTTAITGLPKDVEPGIILVRNPNATDGVAALELAQIIRMQFKEVPCFLYFKSKEGFQKNVLVQNGFNDVFLLPTDRAHLRSCLAEVLSIASLGAIRFYRSVKLIDINAGDILNFDTSLYLPTNHKYVKLSIAGDSLDEERIERIRGHHFSSIQVTLEQLGRFYEYTAQRLKNIQNSGLNSTERREKLTHAIRELMSDLFEEDFSSYKTGQEIMKDCSEIVKSFILNDSKSDWYARIEQVLGNSGDDYSHSGNVSTLAALFSIGLGIGNPEEIALAGLLHDIGITELPYDIQNTPPEKMTPEQMSEYVKHPDLTINLIRSRKIVVSEQVTKMVLQHHELYNGDGYPKGLFGDRIMKEAQIIAIADRFDELTTIRDAGTGKLISPTQAVKMLKQEQLQNPSKIKYNPELLKNILALFPEHDPN